MEHWLREAQLRNHLWEVTKVAMHGESSPVLHFVDTFTLLTGLTLLTDLPRFSFLSDTHLDVKNLKSYQQKIGKVLHRKVG